MDQNDTPYKADPSQGNGFDFNAVFANATQAEAERKVSGKTVPSFPLYVVHFGGAKAGFTAKKGSPYVRPWCLIKAGLDGTEGTLVSDDLFLSVSPNTMEDGVSVPKTSEKFHEDADRLVKILNKIARVGGFGQAHPRSYDKNDLDVYATQFAGVGEQGFDAIVEIREVTEEWEGNKRTRNRIIWESLASPNDAADAKKLAAQGKTALDEALLKIADRNKAAGAAKTGTAGATSRTSPEALFR